MVIENYNPLSIDWSKIPSEKISGEKGFTLSKTQSVGNIRIRLVEYSDNYIADHWCEKGHIIHILKGELIIEYKNSTHITKSGMTHIVGDSTNVHKARSFTGATVLIID